MIDTSFQLGLIKKQLRKQKIDIALISSVPFITYLTAYSNFSIEEREAYLLITKKDQYIITDSRYSEAIEKEVKNFKLFVRSAENPTKKLFDKVIKENQGGILGIEESNLTVSEYKSLKKVFKKIAAIDLTQIRSLKSYEEIKKIERSCLIGDRAFEYIKSKIVPGITEIELANNLEDYIKSQGCRLSFDTIVAFGKNASIPHHQTGTTKLKNIPGQFIKLDFGVKFQNYCSDMTRTVFFGAPTTKQKLIYETVLGAQVKAVQYIKEHLAKASKEPLKAEVVDQVARDHIVANGFPTIPHSLGHGIGLEVHEPPYLSPKSTYNLQNGNVFSIEPGIYLEGFGGVRIEDLFVIQDNKLRQLTKSPKTLTII